MTEMLHVVDARESVIKSWAKDGFSFGCLAGTAYIINTQMPPSGFLNFMVGSIWLLWMIGKANRMSEKMTPDQARAWLDRKFPQDVGND